MSLPSYVLITPARNEAEFIELTIKSMVAQKARPAKWIIVSDGSTDGTDEIVQKYADVHPWIELVRMPERLERHFAAKVNAFNAGYARMRGLKYDVIGNLDGDLSFDEDYFSFLLWKLAEDSTLGLVGTPFKECESGQTYDYRIVSIEHVSGACQLFRRECFEAIGGYVPLKSGGIDLIAVLRARLHYRQDLPASSQDGSRTDHGIPRTAAPGQNGLSPRQPPSVGGFSKHISDEAQTVRHWGNLDSRELCLERAPP